MSRIPGQQVVGWVDVSPRVLAPERFVPYGPGEIDGLFDWGENPNGKSAHCSPYRGQLIIDVVKFDPNAVHQPHKPGDEIVVVLNGTLHLTTDATGETLVINQGERVLIPSGWAGIYRVSSNNGPFAEFTIVPGDYFDKNVAPPPNRETPRRIDPPQREGVQEIHKGRYTVHAERWGQRRFWSIQTEGDEVIQVLDGTLVLTSGEANAAFGAGDVVVLPKGFVGQATATAGYAALIARWATNPARTATTPIR